VVLCGIKEDEVRRRASNVSTGAVILVRDLCTGGGFGAKRRPGVASAVSARARGKVGGIPARLSSLGAAVTVFDTFSFGEGGSDKISIVSLGRSFDETVEVSPSFAVGSSFFTEMGKEESIEYCNEPDDDTVFDCCSEVIAASNVAEVDEVFRT
jgi:hypothetical protein